MNNRRRCSLGSSAVLVAVLASPVGAQRYVPPSAGAASNRLPARRLLTLTFEGTLQSEQKSTCAFTRPSSATSIDRQGMLLEVGANVPRYCTVDGNTGILIEGSRTNYCANSSFESNLTGWTTTGLVAARTTGARLHGAYGLQLTNSGSAAAVATFRATPPASQDTLALSVYVAATGATDIRMSGIGLTHSGAALLTTFAKTIRTGWYRMTARSSATGGQDSFGIRIPPGVSVYLDAVQLEQTGLTFDGGESSYIPTNGSAVTRAAETLTHPALGYVVAARGTVTIDYYKPTPYPAGDMWWVGRADGQDGVRVCEWGNFFWQLLVNGERSATQPRAQKLLYSGAGIHRFQGSWDDQEHVAEVWMDGEVASSQPCPDTPDTLSSTMYLGSLGRWGSSMLHFNGVLMELTIDVQPLRQPTAEERSGSNDYLLLGDVLPEHATESPQTFAAFDGIIFNRIFTEFWNDIEKPRTPQSNARGYSVAALTAAQKALAGKGVTRNFIKAASFGNFAMRPGWEGGYGLPINWFNDTEWNFVFANVTKAADFGRRAGFAGFAIDVEYGSDFFAHEFYEKPSLPQRHDLRSRTDREQRAFARGVQLAQTILRAWPGAQLLFIPMETQYGPLYRYFLVGFIEGARRSNGAWVGLMNEYGYHADTRATAVGTFQTQNGQVEDWIWNIADQRTLSYWRIFGEHFNSAWPLGNYSASDKQRAYRTADKFAQQLQLFREVNTSTTVIYEEMDAWWQLTDRQARSYGLLPGTELYYRNTAPPVSNLSAYLQAIPR